MTIGETLREGVRLLGSPVSTACIDTPDLDAGLLLAAVFGIRREDLFLRANETAGSAERDKYRRLLERRLEGECVAYILGKKEFAGLEFIVNPAVLVPRPDTETLFEAALDYLLYIEEKKENIIKSTARGGISLLDLCTGSGALAIAFAYARPCRLKITASDISPEALNVAVLNAERLLGSAGNISFIESDLFENISGCFDLIVSNPPYIPSACLAALAPEVHREPRLALDGGDDGLYLVRRIISLSRKHLHKNAHLFLEASPEQMDDIATFLESNGFFNITVYRDLSGAERVISAEIKS